jgi:hypothetical protein
MKHRKPIENRNRGSVMSAYLDARAFWALKDLSADTGDAPSAIITRAVVAYLTGLGAIDAVTGSAK